MISKRIIPCLDVKNGKVIKGIQFHNHNIVGDIIELSELYCNQGADELVFYDITASCESRSVDLFWVNEIAKNINIPFCVAGGIRDIKTAEKILNSGADKISINSSALDNPILINDMVKYFGSQCVVVGIDSYEINSNYYVYKYTGNQFKMISAKILTEDWIREVQDRGAGEIVLNCMNQDVMRNGFDLKQLNIMKKITQVPIIASGGAGKKEHFLQLFSNSLFDGALAASVFHKKIFTIPELKNYLLENNVEVRL
jgi:cyclase